MIAGRTSASFAAGFSIVVGSHFDVYHELVHSSPGGVKAVSFQPYVRSGSFGCVGPAGSGPGVRGLAQACRVWAALPIVMKVGVLDAKSQSHGPRAAALLSWTEHLCAGAAPPFAAGIAQQPVVRVSLLE